MKVRKNKKAFTLIELLAVIVILGLLLAIAIPSVTKYITQSRKKTITTTIGNYIGALTNQVNDMEYVFTSTNTIYAVPIECIALERGGTNPFGEWMQASSSYWAYVLVQYDDSTSSYTYGFTFKDSAGYGLYPTTSEKLKESGSQILTDLDLTRPTTGTITNITVKANWTGFDVEDDTKLVVLVASSEGETGNGSTTCTLCQKGKNYDKVEEEKDPIKADKNKPEDELPILMKTTSSSNVAFWNYRQKIKTITFEDTINIPSEITDEYKWDVSSTGNGMVMAYIKPNSNDSNYYDLYIQGDGRLYANPDSSYLFYNFKYVDSINNIEILNTSKVTNMYCMFNRTGYNSMVFTLDLDKFDTSNVTDMQWMFAYAGYNSTSFEINGLEKWNTSNLKYMNQIFEYAGYNSQSVSIKGIEKWDTSKVTTMVNLFAWCGRNATSFDIGDLSNLDTSNVVAIQGMFWSAGSKANWHLDCSNWNVNNVNSQAHWSFNSGVEDKVIPPNWVS